MDPGLDAGRLELHSSDDERDGASALVRYVTGAGARHDMREATAAGVGSSSGSLLGSIVSSEAGGG